MKTPRPQANDIFMTHCERGNVVVNKCEHGQIGWVSVSVLDGTAAENVRLNAAEAQQLADMLHDGPPPGSKSMGGTFLQYAVMTPSGEMSISIDTAFPDRVCFGIRKGPDRAHGALAVLGPRDRPVVIEALRIVALGPVANA